MGKVRQGFIKRLAHQIDSEHHDEVTDSFCLNADLIDEYYELSSIRFRNRVAGYLVSVYKIGIMIMRVLGNPCLR